MRRMQTLRRLIGWLVSHAFVRVRNLNSDPEGRPVSAVEVGVGGEF